MPGARYRTRAERQPHLRGQVGSTKGISSPSRPLLHHFRESEMNGNTRYRAAPQNSVERHSGLP
jgi:hypothetical protein